MPGGPRATQGCLLLDLAVHIVLLSLLEVGEEIRRKMFTVRILKLKEERRRKGNIG